MTVFEFIDDFIDYWTIFTKIFNKNNNKITSIRKDKSIVNDASVTLSLLSRVLSDLNINDFTQKLTEQETKIINNVLMNHFGNMTKTWRMPREGRKRYNITAQRDTVHSMTVKEFIVYFINDRLELRNDVNESKEIPDNIVKFLFHPTVTLRLLSIILVKLDKNEFNDKLFDSDMDIIFKKYNEELNALVRETFIKD